MPGRILIVDDNLINLKLAAELLGLAGFEVQVAGDAEQAQVLLAGSVPDLILMDIALPGMDGLALTRLLKADARFQCVPIVALTAFAMKGDEQTARAAGCDGYITTPLDSGRVADLGRGALVAGVLRPARPTGSS